MTNDNEINLFEGESIGIFLSTRLGSVYSVVDDIAQEVFMATSTEALVTQVVDQLAMVPLVLHLDQLQTEQSATRLSRMVDTDDYGMPVRRERMVRGVRLTCVIPFSGDARLWRLNNGPPSECQGAVDAERRRLTLTLQNTPDVEERWYRHTIEATLNEIDRVIQDQTRTLATFRARVIDAAEQAIARRRRQMQA